jgi:predicted lysophospholipase L1 biosynthesis ABC-type transport system permease subunit
VLAGNIWLDTDTPDTVSATATTVATSTAVLSSHRTTTAAPILQPAMDAFWIAAAAAGLLALITFSAFITDDSRLRRTGVPVLRALGLSSAQLTRARARELLFVLAFALIAGAVAGIGATLIAVAPFVAAAVPGSGGYLSVVPALDPLPWLGFSTAVVAGALLVIGVALARLNGSGPEVRS